VQATAAAPCVFDPLGFSVVMVSFLSLGPASVPDLFRWMAPAKQTLASVASEQVGSRQRLQHLLQLLRQQPLASRLQVLEVRICRDGRFHRARAGRLAHCVLQRAEQASQHRTLLANLLGQPLQTARLPEVALVAHLTKNSEPLGFVQERNYAQVAAQEVGQAAAAGVTGVVRFTKRMP
jgi:hypothetical protein